MHRGEISVSDIEDYLPPWQPPRVRPLRWIILLTAAVAVISAAGAGGVVAGNRASHSTPVVASGAASDPPSVAPRTTKPNAPAPRPTVRPDRPSSSPQPAPAPSSPTTLPVIQAKYGDQFWAVFLAVTPTLDDSRQATAELQAMAAGYVGRDQVLSSLNCQMGAREALTRAGVRLEPALDYAVLLLRFRTEPEAAAFVDAYPPGVVGRALVTWSCAG